MKVVSASIMQSWEKRAFSAGATTENLMEIAINGCFEYITRRFPTPGRALFLCGKGHNGNDGLWLAHRMQAGGWQVGILLSEAPEMRKAVDSDAVRKMQSSAKTEIGAHDPWLENTEPALVFDCLIGAGAAGQPEGVSKKILEWWAAARRNWHVTISMDNPSGLNPDTGEAASCAFQADFTFAIGAVKKGCLEKDGPQTSGRLVPIPLPLPQQDSETLPDFFDLVSARAMAVGLSATTHKYRRGSVSIFAGSPGFAGAAVLASRAALRAGAGIVRLFSHPECYNQLALATPEIMVRSWDEKLPPESSASSGAWVIGPGFGTDARASAKLKLLLKFAPCPLVLDADALALLAKQPQLLSLPGVPLILTPHEGEFARLACREITDRQAESSAWAQQNKQATLLLKGPNTLISQSGRMPSFNGSGHPGMATAGSGDVLSGMVGSLLSQGYSPFDAARLGAYWHGLAAESALLRQTEQTFSAGDLIEHLGAAWRDIRPY
ncbi:MAG: NAD(P)H-hydrate dehydratase [Methylacidiphilales bacterium]|nr:NAD(P)H-hydrate dehydratase [Candidatus Methylacidiphilales bacterium]